MPFRSGQCLQGAGCYLWPATLFDRTPDAVINREIDSEAPCQVSCVTRAVAVHATRLSCDLSLGRDASQRPEDGPVLAFCARQVLDGLPAQTLAAPSRLPICRRRTGHVHSNRPAPGSGLRIIPRRLVFLGTASVTPTCRTRIPAEGPGRSACRRFRGTRP
jgi:hypothetical protein